MIDSDQAQSPAQASAAGGAAGAPAKAAPAGFHCYICGEGSEEICVRCTRDACGNHICEKCLRCSDCCGCDEVPA